MLNEPILLIRRIGHTVELIGYLAIGRVSPNFNRARVALSASRPFPRSIQRNSDRHTWVALSACKPFPHLMVELG